MCVGDLALQPSRLTVILSFRRYLALQMLRYLQALLDYLKSFHRRAFPLQDLDAELQKTIQDFNRQWDRGMVDGWKKADGNAPSTSSEQGIWCEACE